MNYIQILINRIPALKLRKLFIILILSGTFLTGCNNGMQQNLSEAQVMDNIVTRLYNTYSLEELQSLTDKDIHAFITEEERKVLATKHTTFDVNVPVVVSVMREKGQKVRPFWIEESGFRLTDEVVKSEDDTYEVWTKTFKPGTVHLGMNGFDKHRPVYFTIVTPVNKNDKVEITNLHPSEYPVTEAKIGELMYRDWTSITELPDRLKGGLMLTSIRGRARENHLIGAFRTTKFPSSEIPDHVMLNWSCDPKTTIDIQWRTNNKVNNSWVRYWEKDKSSESDTVKIDARKLVLEDRLLQNDRYINRFSAHLTGLKPGTQYKYVVETPETKSKEYEFITESEKGDSFSYIWFGDVHNSPQWGELLHKAFKDNPSAAFYSIAGDNVGAGLYRNEWDEYFTYAGDVIANRPMMPVPGNHDNQDGLGNQMYYDMFALPENAPQNSPKESTYSFRYKNALFLQIDITTEDPTLPQWIDEQLANSDAKWKFAMFHFPPYNWEDDYSEIIEHLCPVFDKYHVDMVMSGHIHYYMRTQPINNNKAVKSFSEGTVYVVSVGIPSNHSHLGPEPFYVTRNNKGWQYQLMDVKDDKLTYKSIDIDGNVVDEFVIDKN